MRATASRARSMLTWNDSAPDMRAFLTGIVFMIVTGTVAAGYPPDHGPFVPGREPTRVRLETCPMVEAQGPQVMMGRRVMVYGRKSRPGPRLRAIGEDFVGIDVEVVDANGGSLAAPRLVSEFPPFSRPQNAFCADLNEDGRLDFALVLDSRGNGLGAVFNDLVVALSSGSTYRVWVVPTATAGREDFVALNGQNAIVKTSFRNNETRRDSQRRSYWVFNLLAIQRDELVLANELDARFPTWVRYFARPNHTAAVLPADEKARIWNLDPGAMFREASPRP
jgi:hypothetical protein